MMHSGDVVSKDCGTLPSWPRAGVGQRPDAGRVAEGGNQLFAETAFEDVFRVVEDDRLTAVMIEVDVQLQRGELPALAVVAELPTSGDLDRLGFADAGSARYVEKRVGTRGKIAQIVLKLGVGFQVPGARRGLLELHLNTPCS